MKLFRCFLLIGLLVSTLGVSVSCEKTRNTSAKIYVKDSYEQPIRDAKVVLYGEPSIEGKINIVFDTLMTSEDGSAVFDFDKLYNSGQHGVAILNIKAFKEEQTAEGIIEVEQEKTTIKSVYLHD
jgi:hypothetical protein